MVCLVKVKISELNRLKLESFIENKIFITMFKHTKKICVRPSTLVNKIKSIKEILKNRRTQCYFYVQLQANKKKDAIRQKISHFKMRESAIREYKMLQMMVHNKHKCEKYCYFLNFILDFNIFIQIYICI